MLVVTAIAAALVGVLAGDQVDEASVLSARIPESATSSLDPALMMEATSAPTTAPFIEHDGDSAALLTTTTTLAPTTTVAPTTTAAAAAAAAEPPETKPKQAAPPAPTVEAGFNPGYESEFASKINSLRSSNGLSALTRDGSLDAAARAWAQRMAERGDLSHSDIGRFLPPWSAAAENVGSGGSVSSLFDLLAGSSGHRSNMLGGYTHVGIGVWVDGSGTLWTAHVFTG
ncbi:MAG: CAP domain-containing protein [Acidimicrobiia bacterium]